MGLYSDAMTDESAQQTKAVTTGVQALRGGVLVISADPARLNRVQQAALALDPGLEVRTAPSGGEGIGRLAWCAMSGTVPLLLVLDADLPDTSAGAVLTAVRSHAALTGMAVLLLRGREASAGEGGDGVQLAECPEDPQALAVLMGELVPSLVRRGSRVMRSVTRRVFRTDG